MDPDNHTSTLANVFRDTAEQYMEANKDADINDLLTALALMLSMHCIFNHIPREAALQNLGRTYDNMMATISARESMN